MFDWLRRDHARTKDSKAFVNVTEGLQRLYREQLLPLEVDHDFHHFYSPPLTDADFAARPMVLLIGQYSSGKSTFIRHLLGRDYPGLRIGPEPTTDRFVAVVNGASDQVIPGNALVVDKSLPFTQLTHFGNGFLSRFECAKLQSQILEGITLIDTPGVLSGEKQRIKRGYEFDQVTKWFADRVDMILLLFDVAKLDISDEFRRVILSCKGNDHKIHVVLNKADRCTTPQLMRVYGALMWNLGKVIDTPEVSRVYIGSFWDEPLANDEQRRLFESEENDLYTTLAQLPRGAAVRKLNDLIKRARLAKVHACLLDHLRNQMPSLMGKDKAKRGMIDNLVQIYHKVAKEKDLPLGDFPDPAMMRSKLEQMDFKAFKRLDKRKLDTLERMLSVEMTKLLQVLPTNSDSIGEARITQVSGDASPFAVMKVGGNTEGTVFAGEWLVMPDVEEYRAEFMALGPNAQGRLTGQKAKVKLVESKLPSNVLHKVWTLADVDRDAMLTLYEFALAMHLVKMRLAGMDLPHELPACMIGYEEDSD